MFAEQKRELAGPSALSNTQPRPFGPEALAGLAEQEMPADRALLSAGAVLIVLGLLGIFVGLFHGATLPEDPRAVLYYVAMFGGDALVLFGFVALYHS